MLLGFIICVMTAVSVLYGCAEGQVLSVADAALDGAKAAVDFCISIGGIMCLWCAIMELMRQSGIADGIKRLLSPFLRRLFPESWAHKDISEAIASNVSANILGLGNAATPMGIKAACGMAKLSGEAVASKELCRFVVLNTASIQLFPTTVCAIRASLGAEAPFDILPAVWISSVFSVCAGLFAAKLMEK